MSPRITISTTTSSRTSIGPTITARRGRRSSTASATRDFARAIREDPKRAKLLYLGTEHGIYISFDDGAKWQSLKQNLPDTPVHDIKVEERDLVIATHGRGVLRDGQHLAAAAVGRADDEQPATCSSRTTCCADSIAALAIDYSLKQPAQKVTVEFMDAQGKVIRTYTGTPADVEKKPAPRRRRRRGRLPSAGAESAGRRGRSSPELGHPLSGRGRFPGHDHVGRELRAGRSRRPAPIRSASPRTAISQTQPFAIRREPHVLADVTDADLQKQFDLAMKVRNRTSEANEAVLLVRGIKPQIKDRQSKLDAKAGPTAKALDDLEKIAQRGRRRDLPGEEPERSGSAELPDQVEQQDRGAARRHRERRHAADRSELRSVRACSPTGSTRSWRLSTTPSRRSCRR